MGKVVVTVLSSTALLCAAVIAARWGGLDTSFRVENNNAIAAAIRRLAVLEVSGIVAGLLVGGFGSRLMMRVMAATSGAAAQGRITQADEVVGKVTGNGTVGLLLFVGIGLGVVGAGLYAVVGRFLPRRAWSAGIVLGLLALGVFARTDPLDPANRDFTFLSPVLLAVVLIAALFVLYGMTLTALAARLERSYPQLAARPSAIAFAPLLLLVAAPPLAVGLLAAVVVGVLNQYLPGLRRRLGSRVVRTAGVVTVALATVAADVWLALAIADILTT